jgi:hypothetical protein
MKSVDPSKLGLGRNAPSVARRSRKPDQIDQAILREPEQYVPPDQPRQKLTGLQYVISIASGRGGY